ncbi:hypothetical protein CHISP_1522 [Chitinispirillum alkaliphilum]|nr:hypothetical protein CHISP_1522 [Chitinispirillum alkaliphilum]
MFGKSIFIDFTTENDIKDMLMRPLIVAICMLSVLSVGLCAQDVSNVSLAVSDLVPLGVTDHEAAIISEQLRIELMKTPMIQLIERTQMEEILKEQGFQQLGCTNNACAVEVGQLLGVRKIVVGSIGTAGSYTLVTARIIDVSTGKVIVSESVRDRGGIDGMLNRGVQEISRLINVALFPELEEENTDAPKKNTRLRRALVWGGTGAVVVGAGVAALLLSGENGHDDVSNVPNTRIDLP